MYQRQVGSLNFLYSGIQAKRTASFCNMLFSWRQERRISWLEERPMPLGAFFGDGRLSPPLTFSGQAAAHGGGRALLLGGSKSWTGQAECREGRWTLRKDYTTYYVVADSAVGLGPGNNTTLLKNQNRVHGPLGSSSPAKDRNCGPCIGTWSLNHWPTREVPEFIPFNMFWPVVFKLRASLLSYNFQTINELRSSLTGVWKSGFSPSIFSPLLKVSGSDVVPTFSKIGQDGKIGKYL